MNPILAIAATLLLARWAFRAGKGRAKQIVEEINKTGDPIETLATNEWSSRNKDGWGS